MSDNLERLINKTKYDAWHNYHGARLNRDEFERLSTKQEEVLMRKILGGAIDEYAWSDICQLMEWGYLGRLDTGGYGVTQKAVNYTNTFLRGDDRWEILKKYEED